MEREEFIKRMVQLQKNKKVSARDMSLSLGQGENYITQILNGRNYPSMQSFFYICEYFGITPREFFDTEAADPSKAGELLEIARTLPPEQLDHLIALARGLRGQS